MNKKLIVMKSLQNIDQKIPVILQRDPHCLELKRPEISWNKVKWRADLQIMLNEVELN